MTWFVPSFAKIFFLNDSLLALIWDSFVRRRSRERHTDRQREQAIYLCNYAIYLTIYPFHPSALCMHESQKQCNECQVASVGKLVQIWWTHVHIEIHKFWRDSDCEGVFCSEWETERVSGRASNCYVWFSCHLFIPTFSPCRKSIPKQLDVMHCSHYVRIEYVRL